MESDWSQLASVTTEVRSISRADARFPPRLGLTVNQPKPQVNGIDLTLFRLLLRGVLTLDRQGLDRLLLRGVLTLDR